MKKWLVKLWKDGVRHRFLTWAIPLILPKHHLAGNPIGSGRKKKIDHLNIDDQITIEGREQ